MQIYFILEGVSGECDYVSRAAWMHLFNSFLFIFEYILGFMSSPYASSYSPSIRVLENKFNVLNLIISRQQPAVKSNKKSAMGNLQLKSWPHTCPRKKKQIVYTRRDSHHSSWFVLFCLRSIATVYVSRSRCFRNDTFRFYH